MTHVFDPESTADLGPGEAVGLAEPPAEPRGREYFEWILGWRQGEEAAWSAQQARAEARRSAAAARAAAGAAARAAAAFTPELSLPAIVSSERPTGEWDLATAVEPEAELEADPEADPAPEPDADAPPRGREYFEWVLGWRQPETTEPAPKKAMPRAAAAATDWLATIETEAPAPPAASDAEFTFRDWMEPADVRTTSEFGAVELEIPEAPPDEPVTIEFATTELAPPEAPDRDEAVTGEFAAVDETVTGEYPTEAPAIDDEDMASPHHDRSFVLKKFHSFYTEIIRFRNQKSALTGGMATAIGDAAGVHGSSDASDPERAAKEQSAKWRELLQLYAAEAKWLGGDASGRFPDAQFAMIALADEVLAGAEWAGRTAWDAHRLEHAFYGSDNADTAIFRDIDHLLLAQATPANRDLAVLYLVMLAAGFRGIHRDDEAAIADYRRRLYHFVYRRDPMRLVVTEHRLFPRTEAYTVVGTAVPRISMVQRWTIGFVLLVIAYLMIAHFAWTRTVADLVDVIARIQGLL